MFRRLLLVAVSLGVVGFAVILAEEKEGTLPEKPKIPADEIQRRQGTGSRRLLPLFVHIATDPKVPFGGMQ